LTCRITTWSLALPGQHQHRTGMPSRVTAIPITTCGRSSRESLDLPWVRNPAAFPGSASSSPEAFSPRQFRATSPSASSSSKYVEVVSKNNRSTSRFSKVATLPNTPASKLARASCSQSIAR